MTTTDQQQREAAQLRAIMAEDRRLVQRGVVLSVTLADGTTHEFARPRMPRHWKSWVMQQMPYGTDFYGCTFSRERIA